MVKRDESSNIFDLAASQKRKVPAKKPSSSLTPPKSTKTAEKPQPKETEHEQPSESSKLSEEPEEKIEPGEALKMIEKMNKLHQDLESHLESTYEKSGLTKHDIRKIVKALSEEDRIKLQNEKQKLEEKVWGALGEGAREQKLRKDQQRLTRKFKTSGGRRNWIKTK